MMSHIDERHQHRSRPVGLEPDDLADYNRRFQVGAVASHLRAEDDAIDQATASHGSWQQGDPGARNLHPKVHDASQRHARESVTVPNPAVRPSQVLGTPRRPTTEGRIRPSDEES